MANEKLSEKTAIVGADVDTTNDILRLDDISAGLTKKISPAELMLALGGVIKTWTVELKDQQGTPNVSATTTSGLYLEIGELVICLINNFTNIDTTGLTATDEIVLTLPIATGGTTRRGGGIITSDNLTFSGQISLRPAASAAEMQIVSTQSGSAETNLLISAITDDVTDLLGMVVIYAKA